MPNAPKLPPTAAVGGPHDDYSLHLEHKKTIAKGQEQYAVRWSTGVQTLEVSSDDEFSLLEKAKPFKSVKKAHKPGAERYQRNEIEPLRI